MAQKKIIVTSVSKSNGNLSLSSDVTVISENEQTQVADSETIASNYYNKDVQLPKTVYSMSLSSNKGLVVGINQDANQQILPTTTTFTINGNTIKIYTFYSGNINESAIIQAFIADMASSVGGVTYIEGELVILLNSSANINVYIDNSGNLILEAENSNKYYIDSSGYLCFDESL